MPQDNDLDSCNLSDLSYQALKAIYEILEKSPEARELLKQDPKFIDLLNQDPELKKRIDEHLKQQKDPPSDTKPLSEKNNNFVYRQDSKTTQNPSLPRKSAKTCQTR